MDGPIREALEASKRGEHGALGRLFEGFRVRLLPMIAIRMDERLKGRIDPDDILQEALTEVTQRIPEYLERRDDQDFFLWVRFLTMQKLIQMRRTHLGAAGRDARREAGPSPAHASSYAIASAILDTAGTPSRHAMRNEQAQQLEDALEGMKEVDREIIVLRHFEHLTNKEAASVLELTEPATSLRHMRALKRLRGTLDTLKLNSEGFA